MLSAVEVARDTPAESAAPAASQRIVVDALAARSGGTAYAAIQVARELNREGPVTVIARRGSIVADGLAGRVEVVELAADGFAELPRRIAWEASGLLRLAGSDPVLSWSGMLPARPRGRTVCVLANPIAFRGRDSGNRLRRAAMRRTASAGAVMMVPSEGMRALAEPVVGRVVVAALGVDAERFTPGAQPGGDVLYVADFYAHKRHDIVIDAWAALPEPRPRLRLIGDPRVDPRTFARVQAAVAARRASGPIAVEHSLTLAELVEAYRAARVLVIASEQESFGMPLLEAQACGTPAVVRDDAALRTAGGPATTYVADGSWTAAIERLLRDDVAHARARVAGLEHVRGFTWAKTAGALRERLLG